MVSSQERLLPDWWARVNLLLDVCLLWSVLALTAYSHVHFAYLVAYDWISMGIIMTLVWCLLGLIMRHYKLGLRPALEDAAVSALLAASVSLVPALTRSFVSNPAAIPPVEPFILVFLPSTLLLRLAISRPILRNLQKREEVLIVGVGALARATQNCLNRSHSPRRVIGHISVRGERMAIGLRCPLLGRLAELERIVENSGAVEVYLALDPQREAKELQQAITKCETIGVPFAMPIPALPMRRARPISSDSTSPACSDGYIHFRSTSTRPYQIVLKRLFDLLASLAALVALSPLLLLVGIAVKLSSEGPVFFKQERLGLYGKPFGMYKFRSMYTNAENERKSLESMNEQSGPVFKIRNDPRITPLGRLIRKFSIDELPQLINILRGEMSIVGPRPPLRSEVEKYENWQRRRLSVSPGLTCSWQISGRSEIPFNQWMLMDMRYIDTWHFLRDIGLIIRTIPVVISAKGAS